MAGGYRRLTPRSFHRPSGGAALLAPLRLRGDEFHPVRRGLRAPIRFRLTRGGGKVNALLHVDPGFKLYAFRPVQFGFQFPLGVQVGISLAPAATLAFGFDLPMSIFVTPGALFSIAPQFGLGFESHIIWNVGIGFNTRFGAAIFAGDHYGYSYDDY